MSKIAYKPVGLLLGAAAGALAGYAFKEVWRSGRWYPAMTMRRMRPMRTVGGVRFSRPPLCRV